MSARRTRHDAKLILGALLFTFFFFSLAGCATYKFRHGKEPYNKGYVVSRDDYTIVEYTVGRNNTVPDLNTARQRFNRRRDIVEHYYKKMGFIENHFKMAVMDPAVLAVKLFGGIFRTPFVGISDYRFEHNPAYREKVIKLEDEKDRKEDQRIKELKDRLNIYVQKDLEKENPNP